MKSQILQFKQSADKLYLDKDFTSATILYFKAWFAIQDYILLERIGQSPKDHSERFRFLKKSFPVTYIELDKEFSTYRDTYSKIIDKITCERIKKIVENELKNYSVI
jgi:hypothetical protein